MDALDQLGGSPPSLWPGVTHVSDGYSRSREYELRIQKLADKIEKLSWMLELMDQEPGITPEGAEYHWQHAHASIR